jgi:hypothetical protein
MWWKRAVVGIPLGLVGMILLLEALLYWGSASLKEKIQNWAGEETTLDVSLEKARLSLLSEFPHISLVTKNMLLINQGDTLLFLENTSWQLQIKELLSRHLAFHTIHLEKGTLFLTKNWDGSWNTEVFRSKEGGSNPMAHLSIHKASLAKVRLLFKDLQSESEWDVYLHSAKGKGSFRPDQLQFSTENHWTLQSYQKKNKVILSQQDLDFSGEILREGNSTQIQQLKLRLGKSSLLGQGEWTQKEGQNSYSLNLQGDQVPIQSLLNVLDFKEDTTLGGDIGLNLTASGTLDAKGKSTLKVTFQLNGGEISSVWLGSPLKSIETDGTLDYNDKMASLELLSFSALYENERLSGHLKWVDFEQPDLSGEISGKLPLALMTQWAPTDFQDVKGVLSAQPLVFSYSDKRKQWQMEGQLAGEQIQFIWGNKPWHTENFHAEFKKWGGSLQVPALESNQTSAFLDVNFVLPQKNSPLKIGGKAQISQINAVEWMEWWDQLGSQEAQESKQATGFETELNIQLALQKASYHSAQLEEAQLDLQWQNEVLSWKGQAKALEGDWSFNQKLHFWPSGGRTLRGTLEANRVDVKNLFQSFDNFDQTFIGHQHLEGKIQALGKMDITWGAEGSLLEDKLQLLVGSKISNGSLKHWPLMENFASFVKVEDLRNIRFAELINIIEIKNGVIFLPTMFVQSNALNLEIAGEHTLDHTIYYNIKVNAGQVLTKKFERHDPQLHPVKAENSGWFNLYYTLSGPLDDFQYQKNRKAVKSHFEAMALRYAAGRIELEKEFGPIPWLQAPRQWSDVELFDLKTAGKKVEFIDDF